MQKNNRRYNIFAEIETVNQKQMQKFRSIYGMKYIQIICLLLFSLAVKSQTLYKTPSGEKYHLGTCRMVKNVSEKLSLNDARAKGLTPCKICNPPTAPNTNLYQQKKPKGEANTVQCKGKTKAGKRCKHMTSIANGYCFQHNRE